MRVIDHNRNAEKLKVSAISRTLRLKRPVCKALRSVAKSDGISRYSRLPTVSTRDVLRRNPDPAEWRRGTQESKHGLVATLILRFNHSGTAYPAASRKPAGAGDARPIQRSGDSGVLVVAPTNIARSEIASPKRTSSNALVLE
jgi:hypothetical protein